MQLTKLATWNNRVDEHKALELAKEAKLQLASAKTLHKIATDDKLWEEYKDCFYCRSGTKMSYKKGETKAIIQHPGEAPKEIYLPLDDGYYKVGGDGIPNGEPSNRHDKEAAHLWRWQDRDWEGLVVRFGYFFGYYRRNVYCYYVASDRCGVLGEPKKPCKHKWIKVCEICGERKK